MKFSWTAIETNDLEESLDFYENVVGLKSQRTLNMSETNKILFLGEGETQLQLIYNKNYRNIDMGKSILIGFKVDSLDEKMKFIKDKGIKIEGPYSPAPSTKFFYIKDPNGLTIQFIEDVEVK